MSRGELNPTDPIAIFLVKIDQLGQISTNLIPTMYIRNPAGGVSEFGRCDPTPFIGLKPRGQRVRVRYESSKESRVVQGYQGQRAGNRSEGVKPKSGI